ncbi:MAG: archaetidylserine decarboxylase [Pseudomonadota bacterium]
MLLRIGLQVHRLMAPSKPLAELTLAERLNFLLTNRLPRRWLTLFIGRFSRIRQPLVRRLSIALWQLFVDDLRLHEARKDRFDSLHDCFIRQLRHGARPLAADAGCLVSPCDAVVGEFGDLQGLELVQAKGFPYELADLLGSERSADAFRNARFLTLRLKSSMYHRFHAPCDGQLAGIRYISGDTWNVNPIALKAVERLFCKNERVVMPLQRQDGEQVVLVAVAAILVASLRLHGLPVPLTLEYSGPNELAFDRRYAKGEEMGYFEHGSTIVLLAPRSLDFVDSLATGNVVRMGQAVMLPVGRA